MKKESILIAVVALIVGVLGGFLIFSMSSVGKNQQQISAIPAGSGSPTDYAARIAEAEKIVASDPKNKNAWLSLGNDYFDTEQAQKAMVRVQRALTKEFFMHDNQKLLITFSAGVTQLPPGEDRNAAIKRADELMYHAKKTGKNKVIAA